MSLKVYAYRRASPDADLEFLPPPPPPANEAAGSEGSRHGFWSHRALVRRGLRILPFLREGDVYADGSGLDELEREVATIRGDFAAIVRETGEDPDWLRFRLDNIAAAIRLAREVDNGIGGVYIG